MQKMQKTQVQSLGWEGSLEEEMATHSSILAWKVPWTKEPGGLQSMGLQRVRHNLAIELQAQALLMGGACPCSDKLFGLRRPSMDTWRLLGRAGSWH